MFHRSSWPQIWGLRFTWGVKMMPQRHGWGWYSPQTTSYILIIHIQSVWAIGMLSQGHMVAPLYRYTGQVGPRFGKSGSIEEWTWCHNVMVEAAIHLRLVHASILDIYRVFEPLVCCLKGIWLHPYTITPAKLPPDLGSQCHNIIVEADIYLRLLHTSILDIYKVFEPLVSCLKSILLHPYTVKAAKLAPDLGIQFHSRSGNDATASLLRLIFTSDTSYIHIRHIQSVWDFGILSQGHMVAPSFRYTDQAGPRFGDSGSLVEWKWCHNVMVEADIQAPLIAIVSCECSHSPSTLRGTFSPCPNMAYQPAFPC